MSRKDLLRNQPTAAVDVDVAVKTKMRPLLGKTPSSSSLPSKVSGAFAESKERFERSIEIEKRLAEGQIVVALDPSTVDPSFASDRMPGAEEAHRTLTDAIREQGQQVPILVRPHPDKPGRYQVAFGHRRLRALAELGLHVNAVVRDLTDEQVVVAQGQENSEREDLSFIEKARFVERLQTKFSRDVIMASLSLHKTTLSTMLSLIQSIPCTLVDAIGPAPGVGRRSWEELVSLLDKEKDDARAIAFAQSPEVQLVPSADRLKMVVNHLKPRRANRLPDVWTTEAGEQLAKVHQNKTKVDISIDRKLAPEFADFVLANIQRLFAEHRSKDESSHQRKNGE